MPNPNGQRESASGSQEIVQQSQSAAGRARLNSDNEGPVTATNIFSLIGAGIGKVAKSLELTHAVDQEELKIGDHIYVYRMMAIYSHHGIVVQTKPSVVVVHFFNDGVQLATLEDFCNVCQTSTGDSRTLGRDGVDQLQQGGNFISDCDPKSETKQQVGTDKNIQAQANYIQGSEQFYSQDQSQLQTPDADNASTQQIPNAADTTNKNRGEQQQIQENDNSNTNINEQLINISTQQQNQNTNSNQSQTEADTAIGIVRPRTSSTSSSFCQSNMGQSSILDSLLISGKQVRRVKYGDKVGPIEKILKRSHTINPKLPSVWFLVALRALALIDEYSEHKVEYNWLEKNCELFCEYCVVGPEADQEAEIVNLNNTSSQEQAQTLTTTNSISQINLEQEQQHSWSSASSQKQNGTNAPSQIEQDRQLAVGIAQIKQRQSQNFRNLQRRSQQTTSEALIKSGLMGLGALSAAAAIGPELVVFSAIAGYGMLSSVNDDQDQDDQEGQDENKDNKDQQNKRDIETDDKVDQEKSKPDDGKQSNDDELKFNDGKRNEQGQAMETEGVADGNRNSSEMDIDHSMKGSQVQQELDISGRGKENASGPSSDQMVDISQNQSDMNELQQVLGSNSTNSGSTGTEQVSSSRTNASIKETYQTSPAPKQQHEAKRRRLHNNDKSNCTENQNTNTNPKPKVKQVLKNLFKSMSLDISFDQFDQVCNSSNEDAFSVGLAEFLVEAVDHGGEYNSLKNIQGQSQQQHNQDQSVQHQLANSNQNITNSIVNQQISEIQQKQNETGSGKDKDNMEIEVEQEQEQPEPSPEPMDQIVVDDNDDVIVLDDDDHEDAAAGNCKQTTTGTDSNINMQDCDNHNSREPQQSSEELEVTEAELQLQLTQTSSSSGSRYKKQPQPLPEDEAYMLVQQHLFSFMDLIEDCTRDRQQQNASPSQQQPLREGDEQLNLG